MVLKRCNQLFQLQEGPKGSDRFLHAKQRLEAVGSILHALLQEVAKEYTRHDLQDMLQVASS